MPCDRPRRQRVQEIVVGPVVTDADDEVRRLLPVREDAPDVDALVDAPRAHLDHAMALQDLGRGAAQVLPEIVQELVRAPGPVLGLRLAVVPRDAHRLPLDVGAGDVGRDPPQETLDRAHPAQVELDECSPFATRRSSEVPVLGAEMDRELAEPLLEARAPATAHDVDVGLGKRCQVAQERADLPRGNGKVRMQLELAQRPVVVEHDGSSSSAGETAQEPFLHLAFDVRRLPPSVALRMPPEAGQEPVRPLAAVELLDALGHGLEPAATLGEVELERRPQRFDHAVDVPRVDQHGPGQNLRRARELREEQRATPAPREARAPPGRGRTRARRGSFRPAAASPA